MKNYFICTFTERDVLNITLDVIEHKYSEYFKNSFIVYDVQGTDELMVCYNLAIPKGKDFELLPKSFVGHRKGKTETVYTINALNMLVEREIGTYDPKYKIDWKVYENQMIVVDNNSTLQFKNLIKLTLD